MKQPYHHKTQYTLRELATGLDATIQGDPNCIVTGVGTIQQANANQITFLTNPLYKKYLASTSAAVVVLQPCDAEECPVNALVTRDPYYAYSKIAAYFVDKPQSIVGIHESAVVGKNCKIDTSASIGANCVLGNNVTVGAHAVIEAGCVINNESIIGEYTHLDANVTVYDKVQIGKRVKIASGVVIGSDGFGLAKHAGVWHKVPQLGTVIIGDDVEIGANCTIDRGAIEDTIIENGVKLDNLIQVGHNVRIGENTAIAGCVGIAGSAVIGKNCMIGGAAGIGGHITIADNVVITGMTAVSKSIRESGVYSSGVGGLTTNAEWRKNSARFHRLDQLVERIKKLEEEKSS